MRKRGQLQLSWNNWGWPFFSWLAFWFLTPFFWRTRDNRTLILVVLLAVTPATLACDAPGAPCPNDAWGVFLPNDEGRPAPNIVLVSFQHMNPDGMSTPGIDHGELMRLHAALKPLVAKAFGHSTTRFEVKVRYTLSKDAPAVFEMQTTGREAEEAMLTQFHDDASALADFHGTAPTVYVLFHYAVSPRAPVAGSAASE